MNASQVHTHARHVGHRAAGLLAAVFAICTSVASTPAVRAAATDACLEAPSVLEGQHFYDVLGSTLDAGIPRCSTNIHSDVWLRYTPSCTGVTTISTCGVNDDGPDTIIELFDGCSCAVDGMTSIGCADDSGCGVNGWASSLTAPVVAGNCYMVRISGWQGGPAAGFVDIACGDACSVGCSPGSLSEGEPLCADGYVDTYNAGCNAFTPVFQSIPLSTPVCGTAGTFLSPIGCVGDEDCPDGQTCLGSACSGPVVNHRDTDWYELIVENPQPRTYAFRATGEYPILVGVIDNGGAAVCDGATLLVSDTAPACVEAAVTVDLGPGVWWFVTTPNAFADVACGSVYEAELLTSGVNHDSCATAQPIGEGSPAVVADNSFALIYDDAAASCATSRRDVYYTYTASCSGTVIVDTEGSGQPDTVLSVLDSCGGAELACDDDGGSDTLSSLTFTATAGEAYVIRVASWGTEPPGGHFQLNISCAGGPLVGACCLPGGVCGDGFDAPGCAGSGGTYQGDGSSCGTVTCNAGPDIQDYWATESPGTFQSFADTPIPPGFFGPGSLPFEGVIEFRGEPIDPAGLGDTDTIVRRGGDPVAPSAPPGSVGSVPIEIVELSLRSVAPITVNFLGGATQQWHVAVDLSATPSPAGFLTATKTHFNGGTFNSVLPVQPRLTFTHVDNPGQVVVLDTAGMGIPPMQLQSTESPFVHFSNADLGLVLDDETQFAVGVLETVPGNPASQVVQTVEESTSTGNERHRVRPGRQTEPPPRRDPWYTWRDADDADEEPNHQTFTANPIPAGFFDPGSEPFTGRINFRGVALDPDNLNNADTIVERHGDPVTAADPVGTMGTVTIEIVALNLTSVSPFVITYGGGQEELWRVDVDLSVVGQQQGTLTATKTHPNGGTFDSVLPVRPRFTFTRLEDGAVRVLDTGLAGMPPVVLQGHAMSFVHNLHPSVDIIHDGLGEFVPGVVEALPGDATSQMPLPDTEAELWASHTVCPPPRKPPPHRWYTYTDSDPDRNFQDITLPGGYFGPGCDPFTGRIRFGGEPTNPYATGLADTAVQPEGRAVRRDDPVGTIGSTSIELVELNLVSTEPIEVVCGGTVTRWDVRASLSPSTPAPVGTMTAMKTHDNGGIFDSSLFVQPLLTFEAQAGCDCGDVNRSGAADAADWHAIAELLSGPDGAGGPGCQGQAELCACADSDHDGDLDLRDVAALQLAVGGVTQVCVGDAPAGASITLDTGAAGLPPTEFTSFAAPFVHTVHSAAEVLYEEGCSMVPGVVEAVPGDTSSQISVPISEVSPMAGHTVCPPPGCVVTIIGDSKICKGNSTVLTAIGIPPGGRCVWSWTTSGSGTVSLLAGGCSALVGGLSTSSALEDITIRVTYYAPNGAICRDTHPFTVSEIEITETPEPYLPENTNTVMYTATIKPPGCTDRIRFWLSEVSDFPGDAMNNGAQSDVEKDYKLKATDNPTFDIAADEQTATTKTEVNSATIFVRAYDYGARGKIKARMVREGCESPERRIPRDDDDDWLPNAYEDLQPDKDKAIADTDGDGVLDGVEDDDTLRAVVEDAGPANRADARTDQGLLGDGLVAFEEYRGFFLMGVHTRTTTATKDVFAHAEANVNVGLGMFPNLAGFNVRQILNTEWNSTAERAINDKRSGIPGATLQRGLRAIRNNGLGILGIAQGIGGAINQSPNETLVIEIDVDDHAVGMDARDAGPDGALCTGDDALVDQVPGPGTGLSAANAMDVLAETVGHEFGHGCHLEHNFCAGDVYVIQRQRGLPNSITVTAGPNGVCDAAAAGDDVQLIPVGQGVAHSLCVIGPGPLLDPATVVAGDDTPAGPLVFSGANGICESTAGGTDTQVLPVGHGVPNVDCISTGPDGLSASAGLGDDVQRIAVGNGEPDQVCIMPGPDGVLDCDPADCPGGDDTIVGGNVTTGPDGVNDSFADVSYDGVISIMLSNVRFPVPNTYSVDDLDQVRFHLKHP
jgi:hypothetical protein